jgi:hypothetical protein
MYMVAVPFLTAVLRNLAVVVTMECKGGEKHDEMLVPAILGKHRQISAE